MNRMLRLRLLLMALCVLGSMQITVAQKSFEELDAIFDGVQNLHERNLKVDELFRSGKFDEAMLVAKSAQELAERVLGSKDKYVAIALHKIGLLHKALHRREEALSAFRQALEVREKVLAPDDTDIAAILFELAELHREEGRYAHAERLHLRALGIREKKPEDDRSGIILSLLRVVQVLWAQHRYEDAQPYYRRSLAIDKSRLPAGPDMPTILVDVATAMALGPIASRGYLPQAEELLQSFLAMIQKSNPHHPAIATAHTSLGLLYQRQNRLDDAQSSFERALEIRSRAFGDDHDQVAASLSNLAAVAFAKRDWSRAIEYWHRSADVLTRRFLLGTEDVAQAPEQAKAKVTSDKWTEPENRRFFGLVKALHRASLEQPGDITRLTRESFLAAQWAISSEAAVSLAQMSARAASGDHVLAEIVRDRQDLVSEWKERAAAQSAAATQDPSQRDRAAEALSLDRLSALGTRIAALDARIRDGFPDYALFASPTPIDVDAVQSQLSESEALVLFLVTPELLSSAEETFVWLVTKREVHWVQSDLGTQTLSREVAALRCGLDRTSWQDEGRHRCAELLKVAAPAATDPLPFDLPRAHALYYELIAKLGNDVRGKNLLLVPSGPLTQLPFQVLVTKSPDGNDNQAIAWMARDHAITVLPAVSSLKALRRVGKPSAAPLPFIGFGNPLLDGDKSDEHVRLAKHARDHKGCAETPLQRTASLRGMVRSLAPLPQSSGLVSLEHVRSQSPLPDTADELCVVARNLKADVGEIRLGAQATEREIKSLSTSGTLSQFRILHFATHGALGGELSGSAEPGLILTPPDKASEEDDGYLSASEIAALKLDADWVILSACNTAGGAGKGEAAEALSGLARAFFYAQARALLVSHWAVNSATTVQLVTTAVGELAADPNIGRGEALRRAMIWMIDKGEPHEAHPAYWAPFIVVGEGGAGR